jgi:hypothetical protein
MEKPEGKRPLGRPRHRPEDNIKMDFREIRWDDMGFFCENGNEASGFIKCCKIPE